MTHIRVIWKGTLPGGETWSVSAAFVPIGVVVAPQPQTLMNQAATAIANAGIPTGLRAVMSQAAIFTSVRLEQRTSSGTLLAIGDGARATPQSGTTTANKPFQVSLVVSLRTMVPGRRGRGRMYWPALGVGMSSTSLRLLQADVDSALAATKTLLTDTQTTLQTVFGDIPHRLAVHSKAGLLENEVNALEMGDVLDVQRRRRDKAIENRTTTSFG